MEGIGALRTTVTELCSLLENAKGMQMELDTVAKSLGLPIAKTDELAKLLQERGIVEIVYPLNILDKPRLRLVTKIPLPKIDALSEGKQLFAYELSSDSVPAKVDILDVHVESRPIYFMQLPVLDAYTEAFLDFIRNKLAKEVPVQTDEIIDPKKLTALKLRFYEAALKEISEEMPTMTPQSKQILAGMLLHRMYGLGAVELLMADDWLEEVAINGASEPIAVFHRKFGWLKTNIRLHNEEEIYTYASQIGRKAGRDINLSHPIMDAALVTGDRVSATVFPISANGNTITVRRFARNPWSMVQFVDPALNTMSLEMAAFLWLSVQYELNILVAGGTASGKTSTLNTFCSMIPSSQRVITIEDSVDGGSEMLAEENGILRKTTVGELVDSKIAEGSIKLADGAEVARNNGSVKIYSMAKNGKIELKAPSSFIRHHVAKNLFDVKLASGRSIRVTGDHSLFTVGGEGGKIVEVKAHELGVGGFIATPRVLGYEGAALKFDLTRYPKIVEGCNFDGTSLTTKKNFGRNVPKIPAVLKLDEDLAFLVGVWLADGSYDKNSVIFSTDDEESREVIWRVAKSFGIEPKMHSDGVSQMLNSAILRRAFHEALQLGGDAYTKRVPAWAFNLEKPQVAALLRGYFSGDGCVGHNEVSAASCSRELLLDVQTLLLRFGIQLRVSHSPHKVDHTFSGRVSGSKECRLFAQHIGFMQGYKNAKLAQVCAIKAKEVSDIIPLPKEMYLPIKHSLEKEFKSQKVYASWKSWQGIYYQSNIGRTTLQALVPKMADTQKLEPVIALAYSDIFWDRIVSITEEEFEGFVYDFSVPENESFVCNNVVAHNTLELQLPSYMKWNWLPLRTRGANPEGQGAVSMLDLMVSSLRMRPDRIIVGEVRRGREAKVLFEAMHTGHAVYSTIHADSAAQVVRRLVEPPIEVPRLEVQALHLIVVQYRDRRKGLRRTYEICELTETSTEEGVGVNTLFKWKPRSDSFEKVKESARAFAELTTHTGLTLEEIRKDLKERELMLQWMLDNKLTSSEQVGDVMRVFYKEPTAILNAAQKKLSPKDVLYEPK